LEIYNEIVKDLLTSTKSSLMIIEDSQKGVIVPDLTEYTVTSCEDLVKLIILGNTRRIMAPTHKNEFSSRSHAILQVNIEQVIQSGIKEEVITSKFLLVDLAGSERGGLEKGIRSHEGSNINKSLLSLCNCINILSDKNKKNSFIPYRDSKLTRLLKDSLGGNILTALIACVSPSHLLYEETINTLNYATRAMKIQKKVTRNIKEAYNGNNVNNVSQFKDIIDSLKDEIEQLKGVIRSQQSALTTQQTTSLNSSVSTYRKRSTSAQVKLRKNESMTERTPVFKFDFGMDEKYKQIFENINSLSNCEIEKYIDE
jgi:kinesin family protein 18/19